MDAKEALQYFKEVKFIDKWGPDEAGNGDPLIMQSDEARLAAISALEKVETLEAGNARLRENADKWECLISRAGEVGLSEDDLFKMVKR